MSDAQKPETPTPARVRGHSPLPSARDVAAPRLASPGGRGRRGGARAGVSAQPRPVEPTPARDGSRVEATPAVEPDLAEAVIVTDGGAWTARVLGRSGGGRTTPLLLLGFTPRDGAAAASRAREALVVGRALDALSDADLEAALGSSHPASEGKGAGGV